MKNWSMYLVTGWVVLFTLVAAASVWIAVAVTPINWTWVGVAALAVVAMLLPAAAIEKADADWRKDENRARARRIARHRGLLDMDPRDRFDKDTFSGERVDGEPQEAAVV